MQEQQCKLCEIITKINWNITDWLSLVAIVLSVLSFIQACKTSIKEKNRENYEIKKYALARISDYLKGLITCSAIDSIIGSVNHVPVQNTDKTEVEIDIRKCFKKKNFQTYTAIMQEYSEWQETEYLLTIYLSNSQNDFQAYQELCEKTRRYIIEDLDKEQCEKLFSEEVMTCNTEAYGIKTLNYYELLSKSAIQCSKLKVRISSFIDDLTQEIHSID